MSQTGFKLFATEETHAYLDQHGVPCTRVDWPSNTADTRLIQEGNFELVINIPDEFSKHASEMYTIRRAAVDFDVPLINDPINAKLFLESLQVHLKDPMVVLEP